MKEGPDIALIGSLIGDPARANMLCALMSGKALTATELAAEAGITAQTASSHLGKLETGGMVIKSKQGRHRYFTLADEDVSDVLESIMGLAARKGHTKVRTGPKDPALRHARVCYNHLAGEKGVQMFDAMMAQDFIKWAGDDVVLTPQGEGLAHDLNIDLSRFEKSRRPMCKSCLDWSARRSHLAGSLGTALLDAFYQKGWATRVEGTRIVEFTKMGESQFEHLFAAKTMQK